MGLELRDGSFNHFGSIRKMSFAGKFRRLLNRIGRKFKKFRLKPISVFLFHQVSGTFDESTMKPGDWTETGQFKRNIQILKRQYRFVSLEKAYEMMRMDVFRFREYAVLTSDDGWASLTNILPWIAEQKIPVTLFLNPGYFDGEHYREKDTEKYLLTKDIKDICDNYPSITFGMHGWEHIRATEQTVEEFRESVRSSFEVLRDYTIFVPFFAYTYGSSDESHDRVLSEYGFIPVLIDKGKNVDDLTCIHRELLDGVVL